jgi:chemotaxis-related protein WspB
MLRALLFTIAGDRYGLPVARVERVHPRLPMRPVPGAPRWVLGIAAVDAMLLPVLDLGGLIGGAPSREALATRIAVVRARTPCGQISALGLLAESMTDIGDLADDAASGIHVAAVPYLARTLLQDRGTVQLIDPDHLVDPLLERILVAGAAP